MTPAGVTAVDHDPSPDETAVVYQEGVGGGPGPLKIHVIATGLVTPLNLTGSRPRWSPDGTRIAFIDQADQLVVANADGSNPTVLSAPYVGPGIAWAPDGQWLLVDAHDPFIVNNLTLVHATTGVRLPIRLPGPPVIIRRAAWKP